MSAHPHCSPMGGSSSCGSSSSASGGSRSSSDSRGSVVVVIVVVSDCGFSCGSGCTVLQLVVLVVGGSFTYGSSAGSVL